MTTLVCAVFFISGSSALIFETLWFRQAGLGFGNSVWASSLVLSGFMGGLALGNALAARYGIRIANPIRLYALAEVAIALTGVGLVYLFPVFGVALAPWFHPLLEHPWLLNPLRLLLAFALLLIPSTAMGVTLPLLSKALVAFDSNFGSVLGRLYGWNTLGAVVGVILAEAYLIGTLGVKGTAATAGTMNLVAAVVAAGLSARFPQAPEALPRVKIPAVRWNEGGGWLIAVFLAGFCLLALEVVWFRFLLLFVTAHSLTFALMLGVVLAGIALGGLAASQWLRVQSDAYRFAGVIAFGMGVLLVLSYVLFPIVIKPFAATDYLISETFGILRVGVPLMFPVSFSSGAFFTLAGASLRNKLATETETVGSLTLANTVGAALGSLMGGFILLPILGMERSFFLVTLVYGGIGGLLSLKSAPSRGIAYAGTILFVLSAVLFPFGSMKKEYFGLPVESELRNDNARIAAVREGLTETIIYLDRRAFGKTEFHQLITNSFPMSATRWQARRYMKLFVYWPMAVHPDLKHALLICYGVGSTAKAMTDSKSIETIDVVDISRDVLETNSVVYPNTTDSPLHDPRVRVHVEDGRYFLQTTDQRFDLITGEPPPPRNAGVVNLYTREYFQLIHDRLAEGGIVTYWLPLHELTEVSAKAILGAFCDVFEDCSLWNGMGRDLMMVGTRNAQGPVSEDRFVRQWNDTIVFQEMKALGFERPEQLGALFIGDARYLKNLVVDSPSLVDNYPKLIEAPFKSLEEANRFPFSFTDVDTSREGFRSSPWIKRLWPERMLTESLPYFDFQDTINAFLFKRISPHQAIEDAHNLLTRSALTTPVLWILGSNSDLQRIVADANPVERAQPAMQFHLGIRLISERNYSAAVEHLNQAESSQGLSQVAFRLRIYALCMSGEKRLAQELARKQLVSLLEPRGLTVASLNEKDLPPFWLWMKTTFGIDPLKETPDLPASSSKTPVPPK